MSLKNFICCLRDKKPQFIMLSAVGNYKTTQMALTLGAEYFMIKPFSIRELVDRIRQIQSLTNHNGVRPISPNDLYLPHEAVTNNSIESQANSIPSNHKNLKYVVGKILKEIGVPTHLKGLPLSP